jgi:16S rRNA (cytidine1402-2'-O)-methyltransferase
MARQQGDRVGRGAIVLAATPIGSEGYASARLCALLESADVIAAEDTRRLRALASRLGIRVGGLVVSHYDANEASRADDLVKRAAAGAVVAVVSDAGMPLVSDPGYRVARSAIAADVPVTCVPGPSAALAALAVSGLATDRFTVEGYWRRRDGDARARLAELAQERRTMVFFESPRRLASTLAAMAQAWGTDRQAVVARELTKVHEEVRRATLGELAEWAGAAQVLGEITIVVGGAQERSWEEIADALVEEILGRLADGEKVTTAVAEVARSSGAPRRALYDAVAAARSAAG